MEDKKEFKFNNKIIDVVHVMQFGSVAEIEQAYTELFFKTSKVQKFLDSSGYNLPNFYNEFFFVENTNEGYILKYKNKEKKEVTRASKKEITAQLLFLFEICSDFRKAKLTSSQETSVLKKIMTRLPEIPEPQMIAFKSENAFCFKKLDFDINEKQIEIEEIPVFKSLIDRCSNNIALICWFGSLFFNESYNQQFVWIYGPGGCGKSSIVEGFENFLGKALAGPFNFNPQDKFSKTLLLGKRLATIPEMEHVNQVFSGYFKSLTGGDSLVMEFKGKDGFQAKNTAKFLITSNEIPNPKRENADFRRLIYSEMQPFTGTISQKFSDDLKKEMPKVVEYCANFFYRQMKGEIRLPIKTERKIFDSLLDRSEMDIEEFLNTYFYFTDEKRNFASINQVNELCDRYKINKREFKDFLKNKYAIKPTFTYSNNLNVRSLENIGLSSNQNIDQNKSNELKLSFESKVNLSKI